jgi:hypothetical protein
VWRLRGDPQLIHCPNIQYFRMPFPWVVLQYFRMSFSHLTVYAESVLVLSRTPRLTIMAERPHSQRVVLLRRPVREPRKLSYRYRYQIGIHVPARAPMRPGRISTQRYFWHRPASPQLQGYSLEDLGIIESDDCRGSALRRASATLQVKM